MEKRGVIEPGRTPPQAGQEKQADAAALEDHVSKRLADAVTEACRKGDSTVNGGIRR